MIICIVGIEGGVKTGRINLLLSLSKSSLTAFCQENGINRLAVFGSALRDDVGSDSDIDLSSSSSRTVFADCWASPVWN